MTSAKKKQKKRKKNKGEHIWLSIEIYFRELKRAERYLIEGMANKREKKYTHGYIMVSFKNIKDKRRRLWIVSKRRNRYLKSTKAQSPNFDSNYI